MRLSELSTVLKVCYKSMTLHLHLLQKVAPLSKQHEMLCPCSNDFVVPRFYIQSTEKCNRHIGSQTTIHARSNKTACSEANLSV